jgi:para-aminobenzoate synthetase / 4-amino-4-deoxychorismate lyase
MSALPHADPGRGVFETMLVIAGRPVELNAHIERLDASVAALYGAGLPASTREAVRKEAQGVTHGKLRITVEPRWGIRIDTEEIEPAAIFPGAKRSISLHGFTVAGGLGEHKWADRRLLEGLEATFAPVELALLIDADGSVLEASRASVFLVAGERLMTPPTDGRILPSIARQQAIAEAHEAGIEVREGALSTEDLRRGEVFLTGSVRGVEPVRSIDGVRLPLPGEISERVAAGLRRRWLRVPQVEPVATGGGGRPDGPPER